MALSYAQIHTQQSHCSLSEDLYSKDTHFLLEFIQNADDNTYNPGVVPNATFVLNKRSKTIRCNERGFLEPDVRAICSVGKSTKKNKVGYIGASPIFIGRVIHRAN